MTEKQIIDFWNKHALDYRLGKISEFGLMERAANHFYNLALEDVEKEVERKQKEAHDFMLTRDDDMYFDGEYGMALEIIDFINQLSK